MRLPSMFAAVLLAAACVLLLQPSAYSAGAGGTGDSASWPAQTAPASAFEALSPKLSPDDPVAVLAAVAFALDQVGDGATYVWRHGNGRLSGAVRMTSTFRDADGRMETRLQCGHPADD